MIPVEVKEPLTRRLLFQQQQNKENMRIELETTDEVQEIEPVGSLGPDANISVPSNEKVGQDGAVIS